MALIRGEGGEQFVKAGADGRREAGAGLWAGERRAEKGGEADVAAAAGDGLDAVG